MPEESQGRGLAVPPRSQRAPWIAAAVVVVVCLGAVLAFVLGGKGDSSRKPDDAPVAIAEGVACPALGSARGALEAGNYQEVFHSVRDARRDALEALDSSDAKFGKPEHIALLLATRRVTANSSDGHREWFSEKLRTAEQACEGLEPS